MVFKGEVLGGVSYFSAVFLPIIFPIIVLFVAKDSFTKKHAKKTLILQIVPVVTGALGIGILSGVDVYTEKIIYLLLDALWWFYLLCIAEFVVIIVMVIWNVICGIKVFRK